MSENTKCLRCKEEFGPGYRCQECGVAKGRVVKKRPRRHGVSGKRGRNSGKVSSGNKKKG
jgi:hypothetical protein